MDVIGTQRVYADAWVSVRRDDVRRPDGAVDTWTVVSGADVAVTIPLDGDRLQLVEQYRHPVGARRWEFPSGSVDASTDPDPSATAARELREETGLRAGVLTLLGTVDVMPSTLTHRCSVFLATDLRPGPPQREPGEQDMRSAWFTRAELRLLVRDGAVSDAKTLAAYALLLSAL